jgi:serine/threonine protein kinase
MPPAIAPFELFTHGQKAFMLMPWYLHTLSVMPSVSSDAALALYRSLSAALDFLHGRGFAHCDVKASNICVDHLGAAPFVLVDLGSVARFGEAACSTEAYVPSDFDASGVMVSSPLLDWWMLAAALAEKAKGGLGFGGARRHERAAIAECVQRHLPRVWAELRPRLETLLTTAQGDRAV